MPSTQKSDSAPPAYHCPGTNHYHFKPTKHDSGWVWGRYIGNIPWYLVSAHGEVATPGSLQGPVYVRGGGNAIYHVDRLLVSGFYVLRREGVVCCCVGRYGEGMMRAVGEVGEGIKQLFRKEDVSDRVWSGERYASGVEDERERGR